MTRDAPSEPARYAAAEPEPTNPDRPVHAVGIGPGDPAYLSPRGEEFVAGSDVVLGFESVVDYVRPLTDADLLACGYDDEADTIERFTDRVAGGAAGTAVLMGDPNHSGYAFLGKVERAVDRPVRVVPGISSVQVAASRARTPMEETTFVTLHKRGDLEDDLARLARDVGERHLIVLPRPFDWMPGAVAARLLDCGADGTLDALVFERLTHDDEAATRRSLADLAALADREESPFSDLSVLVVRKGPRRDGRL